MRFTTTYKNVKNSSTLDNAIQETFKKFESYFTQEMHCNAKISLKGKGEKTNCVEITIMVGKLTFRAESTTDNFYKSVDENYEKIKKQIRRHKDKVISKKREVSETKIEEEIEDNTDDIKIVRKKKFKMKPMSPEEAILQMDLVNHNFFLFLNSETDEVSIVYKREDDGYGLIETE